MADRWQRFRRVACSARERLGGAVILALVIAGAAGCSRDAGVTVEGLRNMTYSSALSETGRVKLVNGEYRARGVPNSSVDVSLKLTQQVALGDLDGDGRGDAAVVLESDPGGSGSFYSLAAVVDAGGELRHVASLDLGDRTDVQTIAIANRTIRLELLEHAPEDPLCCPSLRATQTFYLRGSRLVPANQVAGR